MTGVILFRAQPFHKGHLNMVQKAYEDCKTNNCDLYIFVGSANKQGTKRNPLPIDFRLMLIEGTLHENFEATDLAHIHIYPLDDMTDEADNTHAWGRFLYLKMLSKTRDCDMTIYYADDPRIMLGWFAQDERWCLRFKFLDRFENISATAVRALLETPGVPAAALQAVLPDYVLIYLYEIRQYLEAAQ